MDSLEAKCVRVAQAQLDKQIDWSYAFGTTKRVNGQVVSGSIRDTIDTGETRENITATVGHEKITITFHDPDAQHVFNVRAEIDDLAGESIAEELGVEIVKMLLGQT